MNELEPDYQSLNGTKVIIDEAMSKAGFPTGVDISELDEDQLERFFEQINFLVGGSISENEVSEDQPED